MKRLLLKVCGVRSPSTIEGLREIAPDFAGFIFVKGSPRYVGDSLTREDLESLPKGTRLVGVFQDEEHAAVESHVRRLGLSAAQLHGREDDEYIARLRDRLPNITIIKAVGVAGADSLEALARSESKPDLYLFDNLRGGSGSRFDWRLLTSYVGTVPFLLAGGVGRDQIDEVLELARRTPLLQGIDINSKVELSPGEKDLHAIREITDCP